MKAELNKLIAGMRINEVNLFRAMHNVFKANHKCTFIEETHQNYVLFDSPSFSTKTLIRREISDLWIIAYSPKRRDARMTFLQAKFHNKKYKYSPSFQFTGEYFQYELLSLRPSITNASNFNFPPDILSFSKFDSLGTFGVFYYDSNNEIDLAYSIASQLACQKRIIQNKQLPRKMNFPKLAKNQYSIISLSPQEIELCTTLSIDMFSVSLLKLMVGAPLQKHRHIQVFLIQFFQPLKADPVVADFLNFLNAFDNVVQDGFQNPDGNSPTILLLNVDDSN